MLDKRETAQTGQRNPAPSKEEPSSSEEVSLPARLAVQDKPEYESLNDDDPRNDYRLEAAADYRPQSSESLLSVQRCVVQGYSSDNQPVGDPTLRYYEQHPLMDSLDLAAYYLEGVPEGEQPQSADQVQLAVGMKTRHGILAREALDLPKVSLRNGDLEADTWTALGGHMRLAAGHFDINAGVQAVADLSGIKLRDSTVDYLTTAYPLPKFSTERALLVAAEVEKPPEKVQVHYGETFKRRMITGFDSLQNVYEGFGAEYPCLRTFVAANALADVLGVGLRPQVPIENWTGAALPDDLREKLLSIEDARELLSGESTEQIGEVAYVQAEKTSVTVDNPPISANRLQATIVGTDNEILSEYSFDALTGPELDLTNVLPWSSDGDEPVVAVTVGHRHMVRTQSDGELTFGDAPGSMQIEGLYAKRGNASSAGGVLRNAARIAQGAGFDWEQENISHEGTGTYSPSINGGVQDVTLAKVDLDRSAEAFRPKEGYEFRLIYLKDLLKLAREGSVRHLGLVAGAYALERRLVQPEKGANGFSDAERKNRRNYVSVVQTNGPETLDVQRWTRSASQEMFNVYMREESVRNLNTSVHNTQGLRRDDFGRPNQFRSFRPVYGMPAKSDRRSDVGSVDHDNGHFFLKDFIGGRWEGRKFVLGPFDEYLPLVGLAERLNTIRSDVQVPYRVGLENIPETNWRRSVASSVLQLGYDVENFDQLKRAANELIPADHKHVIPPDVLLRPDYHANREWLVGKLVTFGIMDEIQTRYLYDDLKNHPFVAGAALDLCHVTNDSQRYREEMDTFFDRIDALPEGVNGLQRALSLARGREVEDVGLKIAYIQEKLNEMPRNELAQEFFEESWAHMERLRSARVTLEKLIAKVRTDDPSPENIRSAETLRMLQQGDLALAKQFIERVVATELLPAEDRDGLLQPGLYFLADIYLKPSDIKLVHNRVKDVIQSSYQRIGKPSPFRTEDFLFKD